MAKGRVGIASEDEFEELAQETSTKAASVECSPQDYRDGLRAIIERLEADIAASEETSKG